MAEPSSPRNVLGLTPRELEHRLALFGLQGEARSNLEAVHAAIAADVDPIVSAFYRELHECQEIHDFLSNEPSAERLCYALRDHLLTLGRDMDAAGYFERRLRVGVAHERVGVRLEWYLSAYQKLEELICERIDARHSAEPDRARALRTALRKIMNLDVTLVVEAYHDCAVARLERILADSAERRSAIERILDTDELTRVKRRGALLESLEVELHRSLRFAHPFTLLLIDVDRFKLVNDEHGHSFGDAVLRVTAERLRTVLRPQDIIGRLGGDEFLVGLMETDAAAAQDIAERARLQVSATPVESGTSQALVTVSIGVASVDAETTTLEELIERSDKAMYAAKERGRDQVVAFPDRAAPDN